MRCSLAFLLTAVLSGSAPAQDVDSETEYVIVPRALIKQIAQQSLALRLRAIDLEEQRDTALRDVQTCQSVRGT